jgi:hypothetical protein
VEPASVEYYDPKSGLTSWSTLSASLNTPREGLGAAAAPCPSGGHTCLYAIGGDNNGPYLGSVEYVDPTSGATTWTVSPHSLATARTYLGAVSAPCPRPSTATCLYAIGGYNFGSLASTEYLDPTSGGGWTTLPAVLNTPRDLAAATTACPSGGDACLYAIGGANGGTPLNTVEFYDTGTANPPTVARIAAFTFSRRGSTVRFRWLAPRPTGIVGFALYAGKQRLTPRLIPVHRSGSPRYRYQVHHAPAGPYALATILADGTRQMTRARSG